MSALPLDAIKIGTRFRQDHGDIRALAQSIEVIGLLHPIVVTKDGLLLAGRRRLEACKSLGWETIPVTVMECMMELTRDLLSSMPTALRIEIEENALRKDLTQSELACQQERILTWARTLLGHHPPWPYESDNDITREYRVAKSYPQMSIAHICAMNVDAIAHKDCLLWLWTTNHHMREAFAVLDAWGFKQKTILTWGKNCFGTGDWLRGQTEHWLLAVRGKPIIRLENQTTLLFAKRRGNSQKPVEFYDFVERLCPASRYAYLFSRYRHNEKWDCHGDEAPK